jgi:hypothetical protein
MFSLPRQIVTTVLAIYKVVVIFTFLGAVQP